jgi:hypothetical protein
MYPPGHNLVSLHSSLHWHAASKSRTCNVLDIALNWVDILLDVIGGVESAMRERCLRTTTGVSQRWFSGHFRQGVFNTIALPRINGFKGWFH